jgi:hypothetical protein
LVICLLLGSFTQPVEDFPHRLRFVFSVAARSVATCLATAADSRGPYLWSIVSEAPSAYIGSVRLSLDELNPPDLAM